MSKKLGDALDILAKVGSLFAILSTAGKQALALFED